MRALYCFRPFFSHFAALVPIARAMAEAGHDVALATAEHFTPVVRAAGFTAFATGVSTGTGTGTGAPAVPPVPPGADRDFHRSGLSVRAADLLAICRSWAPDLVVREQTDLAAVVAAAAARVPHATVGLGLFTPRWWWQSVLGGELDAVRSQHGLPPDPGLRLLDPYLYIDRAPRSFQWFSVPPIPVLETVRPTVFDGAQGAASSPAWLDELASRPTVYVTLGTVYHGDLDLLATLVSGVADLDVNVVVTVGPGVDPASLCARGDNVYVTGYVPQSLVLPRCAAVLCHGGFNSIMGALSHGIPLVVVPIGSDQPWNADRCRRLGVGLSLAREHVRRGAVRTSIDRVLADPSFGREARRLQGEIDRLPGPDGAVELLTGVAAGREAGVRVCPRLAR